MPVWLYPKQCPTLPHVSPKFPRSVRLCPQMTSYNFLLSDWLTANALMIDGLYLETRESTLSVDVWNAPVGFGESLAITWRMIQKASDIPPVYPSFDHCFSTKAYDVEFWGTYHLWSMHAYPNTPCFNMLTLRSLNITAMFQRHLHMYFHERKCLNFDRNFIEDIYTYGTPNVLTHSGPVTHVYNVHK